MNRSLPWLTFASFCIFGAALLFQLATETPINVIHQNSRYAVLTVSDSELTDAIMSGRIRIESKDPHAKTILKVTSREPTRIYDSISLDGSLNVINPAGIIVGPKFSHIGDVQKVKVIPRGKVYALAIQEEGKVRAAEVSR